MVLKPARKTKIAPDLCYFNLEHLGLSGKKRLKKINLGLSYNLILSSNSIFELKQ